MRHHTSTASHRWQPPGRVPGPEVQACAPPTPKFSEAFLKYELADQLYALPFGLLGNNSEAGGNKSALERWKSGEVRPLQMHIQHCWLHLFNNDLYLQVLHSNTDSVQRKTSVQHSPQPADRSPTEIIMKTHSPRASLPCHSETRVPTAMEMDLVACFQYFKWAP